VTIYFVAVAILEDIVAELRLCFVFLIHDLLFYVAIFAT